MNPTLEQQLMDRFPFMEARHIRDAEKLNIPVGCDCQDGWYGVIYTLCEKIEQDLLLYPDTTFTVIQVKEKYGRLCFYTSSICMKSKIFDYIAEAEQESAATCENCGSKDDVNLYGNYWVRIRCESCETDHNSDIRD